MGRTILAPDRFDRVPESGWLTTADVARMLGVTPRGVRWLAGPRSPGARVDDSGPLPSVRLRSGQHLFWWKHVEQLVKDRANRRLRRRQLVAIRPQMVKAGQQLRFAVRPGAKEALPQAEVKPRGSLRPFGRVR
jgi:hypothetical protein